MLLILSEPSAPEGLLESVGFKAIFARNAIRCLNIDMRISFVKARCGVSVQKFNLINSIESKAGRQK